VIFISCSFFFDTCSRYAPNDTKNQICYSIPRSVIFTVRRTDEHSSLTFVRENKRNGLKLCKKYVGDSVVGIATRYGQDGPGIASRWGQVFPHPSRPAMGPTQPTIKWVPCLFPGVKTAGRGVCHPPPSRAEIKERIELYLYPPSLRGLF